MDSTVDDQAVVPAIPSSIWEQMLTEERRQLASQLGVRVSDLEEQQNLLLTIAQSQIEALQQNGASSSSSASASATAITFEPNLKSIVEEDDSDGSQVDLEDAVARLSIEDKEDEHVVKYDCDYTMHIVAERENKGGPWYRLPQVLVDEVLMFLGDPDALGYVMSASKACFPPTERIFKYFCEQIYPRQTARKVCRIDRWITWRNMLINRPRLRMNGIYTLRTMYSKGYCNDAFWEEKKFESVEVKYYRHFRFFNDGRVLYSLDVIEPYDVVKIFERGEPIPRRVFAGRYSLTRNELHIDVQLHYCDMSFDLLLLDGDDGFQGKHNMLKLLRHSSSVTGGGRRLQIDHVMHPIPVFHDFRFFRFWHLHPDPPNVSLFPDML